MSELPNETCGEWARHVAQMSQDDGAQRALMPKAWAELEPWTFDLTGFSTKGVTIFPLIPDDPLAEDAG